jgi:hypothetical protein
MDVDDSIVEIANINSNQTFDDPNTHAKLRDGGIRRFPF